jgi:hypothetical protein
MRLAKGGGILNDSPLFLRRLVGRAPDTRIFSDFTHFYN